MTLLEGTIIPSMYRRKRSIYFYCRRKSSENLRFSGEKRLLSTKICAWFLFKNIKAADPRFFLLRISNVHERIRGGNWVVNYPLSSKPLRQASSWIFCITINTNMYSRLRVIRCYVIWIHVTYNASFQFEVIVLIVYAQYD